MRFLQVFHKNGHHDVDKNKLRHEDENDEKNGCDNSWHAAISDAVGVFVTFFPQSILHNTVPIVASGNAEQGKESHPEIWEMGVLPQPLAGKFVTAFC